MCLDYSDAPEERVVSVRPVIHTRGEGCNNSYASNSCDDHDVLIVLYTAAL